MKLRAPFRAGLATALCLVCLSGVSFAAAEAPTAPVAGEVKSAPADERLPTQHGVSLEYGYVFDPQEDLTYAMARVFAIYDYASIWRNTARKELRFKIEGAAGSTITPSANAMVSANMFAMYYPWFRPNPTFRPYIEGGIGIIYTQFRVQGQGLHFNFNPILGVGVEMPQKDGKNPFMSLRTHHISNGNLYHENRGVNAVVLQAGRYF
ncbi:acyloxyacyl hydrolase [Geomonas sp. RF6]|uniref:acyloxyacyl hydrolase n=1 Tax=Geomonas sp. RF6 TaxID=2897342 RepID=UPI001E5A2BEE|nr:acyloxyacyl hydrolase [Geomonas sp. RF6]UFS69376.1 acyloxyacyl hydrolase [Geomonas sp. RF6]